MVSQQVRKLREKSVLAEGRTGPKSSEGSKKGFGRRDS